MPEIETNFPGEEGEILKEIRIMIQKIIIIIINLKKKEHLKS